MNKLLLMETFSKENPISTSIDNLFLREDNHDVTLEYEKIRLLSLFRESLINYFAPYATKLILRYNPHFSKPPHICQFFNEIFVKWFFNNNISGNIKAFVPLKFEIIEKDLCYIIARNGNKKLEHIVLDYDRNFVDEQLEKLHNSLNNPSGLEPVYTRYIEKSEFNKATNMVLKSIQFEYFISSGTVTDKKNPINRAVVINYGQFERLKELYVKYQNSPDITVKNVVFNKDFINRVGILLLRYDFLGSLNEHLSVPPKMLKELKIGTELFGTPFNTSCLDYCSPFYDVEKYFNSKGSFFDMKFESGKLYIFNPPFDEDLMKFASAKLLNELENIPDLVIIITLPVWDSVSQKALNIRDNGMDFEAYEMLKNSKFCRDKSILHKNIHLYYNYFDNRFVSVSYTHLLLLSNCITPLRASTIDDLWRTSVFTKKH